MSSSIEREFQLPPHSDNAQEELARVRQALATVFSAPCSASTAPASRWIDQRQLADRYLTSFQTTAVSWLVCDLILQDNSASVESQQSRFFAAQTLHTKCRGDIHELPTSSLPSLRDSLLNHLRRACNQNFTAITTRLALCVSALAVQMQWTTIVDDLIQEKDIVLSILRVLPEETACNRLLLADEGYRFRMRDHLVESAPLVFHHLHHIQTHEPCQQQVTFEVLHTWIRYVPVRPSALIESPLIELSVRALWTTEFLEPAADVVVEVLRMYPSHHPGNEYLVHKLIPLLSQLPLEQALQQDNEDVQRAYCRVVTEMGESYLSWILSKEDPAATSQLVQRVLKCSRVPDTDIAIITLNFWYRLVMDLELVEPYDWRQELIDAYTPHLLGLIDTCVKSLMRYPTDEVSEDRLDDIKRQRFYVSETIDDCCRLLGGQIVIHRLLELLRQSVSFSGWQESESCLACISAIHRFVPSDENELLPACFYLISQLPGHILPLRFTACKTIGKFADWLSSHHQYLQPLLPYLSQSLTTPEIAPAASIAIKELCECSNQNFSIAEPALKLYFEFTGRLDLADDLQILEGVCKALSRQMRDTNDEGIGFLVQLVQPIGNRLSQSVSEPSSSARKVIPEIERLTVLVQHLTISTLPKNGQNHPIIDVVTSTWALLDGAMNRFPSDNLLAEKICRFYKHALRSTGSTLFAPLLEPLVKQLVSSFERTRQSPFLYAASICVSEYGQNQKYSAILFDMVNALATIAFTSLTTFEDMTSHPDIVEELFYLAERMMNHCPDRLSSSRLMVSLLQCAVVGMRLDHQGANKGTYKFLEAAVSYGLSLRELDKPDMQAALERALTQEGQAIVWNLAGAMVGDLPSYSSHIPEILWKLNLLCPRLLSLWLATALETMSLPEHAKNDFMGALAAGLARDEFSLATHAFQSASARERRFRKPHYELVKQSIRLP